MTKVRNIRSGLSRDRQRVINAAFFELDSPPKIPRDWLVQAVDMVIRALQHKAGHLWRALLLADPSGALRINSADLVLMLTQHATYPDGPADLTDCFDIAL